MMRVLRRSSPVQLFPHWGQEPMAELGISSKDLTSWLQLTHATVSELVGIVSTVMLWPPLLFQLSPWLVIRGHKGRMLEGL